MMFSRFQLSPKLLLAHRTSLLSIVLAAAACNAPTPSDPGPKRAASVAARAPASAARVEAAIVSSPVASAVRAPDAVTAAVAPSAVSQRHQDQASQMRVERFVVATGVQDREPLLSSDALPSDGTAIYAFAELANPQRESQNVRVTFERKGSRERVGDVTLPVPASTSRHRTWAFTRFIRTAGVWEAVLWSESGTELSRTSFEVKAS